MGFHCQVSPRGIDTPRYKATYREGINARNTADSGGKNLWHTEQEFTRHDVCSGAPRKPYRIDESSRKFPGWWLYVQVPRSSVQPVEIRSAERPVIYLKIPWSRPNRAGQEAAARCPELLGGEPFQSDFASGGQTARQQSPLRPFGQFPHRRGDLLRKALRTN